MKLKVKHWNQAFHHVESSQRQIIMKNPLSMGKFGRNNFVYDLEHGSYIWIEIWVVDAVLEYDPLSENIYLSECSKNCKKCIEACPTNALSDEFTINRSKCIEHLALQRKTMPSEIELKQMGLF